MAGVEKVFDRYRTAGTAGTTLDAAWESYARYEALGWLPEDKAARILDIGCGAGEFLEFLASRGYANAEGVDYSREQIAWCQQKGLHRTRLIDDARGHLGALPDASMPCFVMNHVLEHVPKGEIIALLELLRSKLTVGGGLVIQVPNMANLYGLAARYLDFTHEVGFTEHSLKQVLITAGFEESSIHVAPLPVAMKFTPKRLAYWSMNRALLALHRAAFVAAVGADAPTIFTKSVAVRAVRTS
ncbi:MAG: class I SAM-dependent methyltransferase [Polyangiaceae bacterium]